MRDGLVIWRISDSRRGHDIQSHGLVNALSRRISCVIHDIQAASLHFWFWQFLLKKYPPGNGFPRPHLIIGAGHHTHLSMLCARRAYGGRIVVIMKPSLPVRCFDFCLIPDHDNPGITDRIIVTRGAINAIVPTVNHDKNRGLIMIGGPSRHYGWDDSSILQQIGLILKKSEDIIWNITDSPRTPASTSNALGNLKLPGVNFNSYKNTGPDWVTNQLLDSGCVWVSEDSMSMIYESLTAGAATGLLRVPVNRKGKLTKCIQSLIVNNMITPFDDWVKNGQLSPPDDMLNEAVRCAEYLLEKIK
jgi:mitochondrial fission protein ELM1